MGRFIFFFILLFFFNFEALYLPSFPFTYYIERSSSEKSSLRNVVIIAQYDENLDWALGFMDPSNDISQKWSVIIYSKVSEKADALEVQIIERNLSHSITVVREPENWGCEASSYLRFLVDNYNKLPPLMFFVHGSPFSHTPFLREMLTCTNPDFQKYFGAGDWYWHVKDIPIEISAFKSLRERYEFELQRLINHTDNFEAHRIEPVFGGNFSLYASAQFLVGRASVRRRPHAVWKALLTSIMDERGPFLQSPEFYSIVNEKPSKAGAYMLEVLWHELFGDPRNSKWRTLEETCGRESDQTVPFLMSCCELNMLSTMSSQPCRTWNMDAGDLFSPIC